MGVGSIPTTLFVAIAFLMSVRFFIDYGKEIAMKTSTSCRKAFVKPVLMFGVVALFETSWAIATNVVAGLVPPTIH